MTEAYNSIIDLSCQVRFGLLMRQSHHWAALVFMRAIVVHQARVFFTGAFRRPRMLNWVIGVTSLLLGFFEGSLGFSLPVDVYSGKSTIIGYSIAISIPFFGSQAAYLLWGGRYPGTAYILRFYVLHVYVLPAKCHGSSWPRPAGRGAPIG